MERSFSEALKQRRTYYSITNQSPISDQEIECIVNMTVTVSGRLDIHIERIA